MFPYSQLYEPIGDKGLPQYAQKDDLMEDCQ